jgi:hypothetical protein
VNQQRYCYYFQLMHLRTIAMEHGAIVGMLLLVQDFGVADESRALVSIVMLIRATIE